MSSNVQTTRPARVPTQVPQVSAHIHAAPAPSGTFAARLNRLFAVVHPPDRGPYTNQDVIQILAMRGTRISATYLSQLRTGQRRKPSKQKIEAIAGFFGVRTDYFTDRDEAYRRAVEADLDALELAHDPGVRLLLTALTSLPPAVRERVMTQAGI